MRLLRYLVKCLHFITSRRDFQYEHILAILIYMVTPSLLNYVQQSLSAGKTRAQITSELQLSGGWNISDIDEAFSQLQNAAATKQGAGSSVGSFFIKLLILILIVGGVIFFWPTIKAKIAALQHPVEQPAPVAPIVTEVQTPVVSAPTIAAPIDGACADNDMDCFVQAATACTPATEVNTTPFNIFGLQGAMTTSYSIATDQNSACVFTITPKNIIATTPSGQALSVAVQAVYTKLESRKGICTFPNTSDLVTLLKNWQTNSYTTTDFTNASCTGTYFSNKV